MINLNNLPTLKLNHEWLIDNDDYLNYQKNTQQIAQWHSPENFMIVYSYLHDFKEVVNELVNFNIEFSHHACHLSDETYLLINIKQ